MAVPDLVRERLGGEKPATHVPLGGDDELWLTPTRGLVYRGEGLLSGETVEEYALEAQTLGVSEGRRKTTIRLDRGYDGSDELTVPAKHAESAIRPVVQGVLAAAGVTDDGEEVQQVFRLGELSLVVTDGRVVKHVGSALWTDEDYEEYPYERVTDLDLEHGSVSSELVIEVDGRPQRIKTPSEDAHEIRKTVEGPLLATHDVDSLASLRAKFADDEAAPEPDEPDEAEAAASETSAESGGLGSLLELGDLDDAREELRRSSEDASDVTERPATGGDDVAAEIAALRETVERQGERIEEVGTLMERLIEELRRVG